MRRRCFASRLLVAALVLVVTASLPSRAAGTARSLEGHWEGAIQVPGQTLDVQLDFSLVEGAWKGTITIPAQGARNLPLKIIAVEGDSAEFAITGVPGEPTFKGKLGEDGKSFAGEFTQAGQAFPFSLASGIDPAAKATKALQGIDQVVEAALADWKTPGLALAVVAGDKVILAKGYGYRDVEGKLPVTSSTLFAIGSSTKAFTTFVLGLLVDDGKLGWDEPVARYIPGFRLHDEYASAHLTPRDMVTHRSGMPRHDFSWYNNEKITRAELVHRLRYLEPNRELRERWQYNNLMYLTAGHLIEKLTGLTWEEAVRSKVLEPLGMKRTNFSVHDSRKDDDHALPYLERDDEVRKVDFRPITVMGPAGSINSSVEEIASWMRAHLNGGRLGEQEIISRGTLTEMHTPQMVIPGLPDEPEDSPASYGMGWFIETWRGHYMVHHGGNIDGFTSLVTLFPRDGIGVVVLVNKNGSALNTLVTKTVADRVLGLEAKDWIGEAAVERDKAKEFAEKGEEKKDIYRVKETKTSRPLSEFAGSYEHPGYGPLEIREEKNGLVMIYNGMTMPLEHWHYDVFNVAEMKEEIVPEDLRVSFQADARGRVTSLSTPFEVLGDPIVFDRLPDRRLSDPAFLAGLTGTYEIPGQEIIISLKGTALMLRVAGQPTYVLEPSAGDEFRLEGINGYSIRFDLDDKGRATRAWLIQPNGVFEVTRVEEE